MQNQYELRPLIERARLKGFKVHYLETDYQFQLQVFDKREFQIFSRIATLEPTTDDIQKGLLTRSLIKKEAIKQLAIALKLPV